jgi:mannose-6-phosphate isomerase-like protein (cupin superfamily)
MRVIGIVMAVVATSASWAQQPTAQSMKTFATFASGAEVQSLIANAKKIRTPDQPMVSQPIVQLAPYRANLEYRPVVGPASIHEKEAELFYVIEGAGTLVTGGKLANEKRTNAENLTGTALEGGTAQAVSKGDVFIVPENTGHWFSEIKSPIVVMSLHVPRSGAK